MKFKVNIKFVENYSKVIEANSQDEANQMAKELLDKTSSPNCPSLSYYDGNPEYDYGIETLTLDSVEPIIELEDSVSLSIKRIEYILKHESNTVVGVYPSGDGSITIQLANGMNFQLTTGEMEYRAEEEIEIRKAKELHNS